MWSDCKDKLAHLGEKLRVLEKKLCVLETSRCVPGEKHLIPSSYTMLTTELSYRINTHFKKRLLERKI